MDEVEHAEKMQEWVTKGAEAIGKWGDPPLEHGRCDACMTNALCFVVGHVVVGNSENADQARELFQVAARTFGQMTVDPMSFDGETVHWQRSPAKS